MEIFSIIPVVVALIMLLFKKVVTAGKSTVDETCLTITGVIVTGVIVSSCSSSDVGVDRLHDGVRIIVIVNRQIINFVLCSTSILENITYSKDNSYH